MKPLAIYGAGGLGKEALMIADYINTIKFQWNFLGFFDDDDNKQIPKGFTRLGGLSELNSLRDQIFIVIAIADTKQKYALVQKIKNPNVKFANLIHPTVLSKDIIINEGVIVGPYCCLGYQTSIGAHTFIGSHCTIGHDTDIGEYCSIMPATNVSGFVKVHRMVFMGVGAKILQNLIIGSNSTVGAGAVVTNYIQEKEVVMGIPAKPHRSNC